MASENKSNKGIVINLDDLERTKQYKDTELIYGAEFRYLLAQIKKKVQENANSRDGEIQHHPCFFINGGRGSGKTTLLQALKRALCEVSSEAPKIAPLAELDPTILSDGENFFVHMLGHVHKLLNKYVGDSYKLCSEYYNHYKRVYESMDKLTNGVSVLLRRPDSLGNVADASYFVQESVEGGINCTSLQDDFAHLMEELCSLLKVDALLVTVDDADMNFNKCSEVFETIRKYLLNRRIVYVFAGDLKLYTMVIRGMQMKHFGELSLSHDKMREKQREQLMDNLEEQYIMKLFPLNNRISLLSFGAVLEKKPILCDDNTLNSNEGICDYLKRNLSQYASDDALHHIVSFMSILSMRSALQLLDYCRRNISDDTGEENYFDYWCDGVRKVTSHALIKHGVDYNAIREKGARKLFKAIREHALRLEHGMEGVALRPGMGRVSFQLISFYLFTELIGKVRTLKDVYLYILSVFPRLQTEIEMRGTQESKNWQNIKGIRNLGAVCATEMLPLWKPADTKIKMFANGSIPLFLNSLRGSDMHAARSSVQVFVDGMIASVTNDTSEDTLLYFVAMRHALNRVMGSKQNLYCLSVYNLLAFIVRLLQIHSENPDEQDKEIWDLLYSMDKMPFIARGLSYREPIEDREKTVDLSTLFMIGIKGSDEKVKKDVVTRVRKWIDEYADRGIRITADSLSACWRDYINECYLATKNAVVRGVALSKFVMAGDLFSQYLGIFEDNFSINVGKDESLLLSDCVKKCPLWEMLRKAAVQAKEMHELCNQVNIGPLEVGENLRRIKISCELKLDNKRHHLSERAKLRFQDVVRSSMNKMYDKWKEIEGEALTIYMEEVPNILMKNRKELHLDDGKQEEIVKIVNQLMGRLRRKEKWYKDEIWSQFEELNKKNESLYLGSLQKEIKHAEDRIRAEIGRAETESELLLYAEQTVRNLDQYGLRDLSEAVERFKTNCGETLVEWGNKIENFVREQLNKPLPKTTSSKKRNTAKKK